MGILESCKVVPIASDADLNVGATQSGDSINMANVHEVLFIVGWQTVAGANADFAVYGGATDGALTAVVPFKYALMSAVAGAANADVPAAWTDATALVTGAHATDDNKTLLIYVHADSMAAGHKWLTFVTADTATGATGNYQCHALVVPRHMPGGSVLA